MLHNNKNSKKAFTMIEVLVASALLAILSVGSYASYRLVVGKGRDARRQADFSEMHNAFSTYYDDNQHYPPAEDIYCDSNALEPYISEIPCDPANNAEFFYDYQTDAGGSYYILTVKLDSGENYSIASDASIIPGAGGGGEQQAQEPTCGTDIKICIPNTCSECCPGSQFRCNTQGTLCLYDAACGL